MNYRYFMNGMFWGDNKRSYEIEIPAPNIYGTKDEAMKDSLLAYRFVSVDGEPVIAVYSRENHRMETQEEAGKRMPAMLTWVEGTPVAMYTYKDFIAKGGSIRILKAEKEGSFHIDAAEDFEATDETFKDIFPESEKWTKPEYIDNEAYYIAEVDEYN